MSSQTAPFGCTANLPVDDPQAIVERAVVAEDPHGHDPLVRVRALSVNPVEGARTVGKVVIAQTTG